MVQQQEFIQIKGVTQHNLKNISFNIPLHQLVVVTGVSGSGKSTLAFDVLAREGQRRYWESFPSYERLFLGKMKKPAVESISSIPAVIALSQYSGVSNSRSTVGTISDLTDLLRLMFARIGKSDKEVQLTKSLFSTNTPEGACPVCNGLGEEENISLDKLITDPQKTLREGALAPTLPTGYIMYSQVTMDVLNQVCEAHGFHVDIPWNELTAEQQHVVLNGSKKLKVPIGKHSIESRLKWTGIAAKPREEDFYKGLIPVMSEILRRDRNKNILKYVESVTCDACKGKKLNQLALSVLVNGKNIADLQALNLEELQNWLENQKWKANEQPIAEELVAKLNKQLELLIELGLGYLRLSDEASTLTGGEIQRIRLVNQVRAQVSDALYVFDEPSAGLHDTESKAVITLLCQLVSIGNSVIVVEHDLETIQAADWVIEIGPEAGQNGGEVLFEGTVEALQSNRNLAKISPTYRAFKSSTNQLKDTKDDTHEVVDFNYNNGKVSLKLHAINVVTGVSGAGKRQLVRNVIGNDIQVVSEGKLPLYLQHENPFSSLQFIDQKPIGRTPRSNPATYTGLADLIRDLLAKQRTAKSAGLTKSSFSFNTKGGRCETCEGAGVLQVGMHLFGNVQTTCGTCEGKRFKREILAIQYQGKSIADVYDLTVNQAVTFFHAEKKITNLLVLFQKFGLGYLKLGQPSTQLSGGEAQRIKLVAALKKNVKPNGLIVIEEPTSGLQHQDVQKLINAFQELAQKHTVLCIEYDKQFINASNWLIELGRKKETKIGKLLYQGIPTKRISEIEYQEEFSYKQARKATTSISLKRVTTHGLKNIDVTFLKHKLNVVVGVSGSGKSSLVYDTLFAESFSRFTESLSAYTRSRMKQQNKASVYETNGLGPVIALKQFSTSQTSTSTVGTRTGIQDLLRLLFARFTQLDGSELSAQHFSFNHELGACPACEGKGTRQACDVNKLITSVDKSVETGLFETSKSLKFYSNPDGQFMAILRAVAKAKQLDLRTPWNTMSPEVKQVILYGTGPTEWETNWHFKNKTRSGIQAVKAKWRGFAHYIEDEYERKLHNKSLKGLEELFHTVPCKECGGARIKLDRLRHKISGLNLHEFGEKSILELKQAISTAEEHEFNDLKQQVWNTIMEKVIPLLDTMIKLGIGHLHLNRRIETLSGGEEQRVKLIGQFESNLTGITYVLDEPTIGLNKEHVSTLLSILRELTHKGNTVVLVEHDKQVIEEADHIIELGPAAGEAGGEVIFSGNYMEMKRSNASVTSNYLNQLKERPQKQCLLEGKEIVFKGISMRSLTNYAYSFYESSINCITGVSGIGKTTLLKEVVLPSMLKQRPVNCLQIKGKLEVQEVVYFNQKVTKFNRLKSVASYSGLLEEIQKVFSKKEEAKQNKLKKNAFSYFSNEGKCKKCKGLGEVKVSMDSAPDLYLNCEACNGSRYDNSINAVKHKGYSISDIIGMSISAIQELFLDVKEIRHKTALLKKIGLGHLRMAQGGHTLSGGETQRLKLANQLFLDREKKVLFLLDEPSSGLHFLDIENMVTLFREMTIAGHTIIYAEHNEQLIEAADSVVEITAH